MNSSGLNEKSPRYSVVSTNYNCAHALHRHLSSVYDGLAGIDFEYAVVDNFSRDGSIEVLRSWEENHGNFRYRSAHCTMGRGRNLAVEMTRGPILLVVDTDVVYGPLLRPFVERCSQEFPQLGVQAIYLGVYPRDVWQRVGGRRNANVYEDVDFWMRLHARNLIRWYPVSMGENLKEETAIGGFDHLSRRYGRIERVERLLRREWDLWATRAYEGLDLARIIETHTIDFGLAPAITTWTSPRPRLDLGERVRTFGRHLFQVIRA